MDTVWGWVLIVFALVLAWLGQLVSAAWPGLAERVGLQEREADVDPAVYADARGEAIWDALILWVLPVAGVLLLLEQPWWPLFGLTGGAIYVYFAGRIVFTRLVLQRRGVRVGQRKTLRMIYAAAIVWGIIGAVTIVMATAALPHQ